MAFKVLLKRAIYDSSSKSNQLIDWEVDWSLEINTMKGLYVHLFGHDGKASFYVIYLRNPDIRFKIFDLLPDTEAKGNVSINFNKTEMIGLLAHFEQKGEIESFIKLVSEIAVNQQDSGFDDFLQELSEKL